MLDGLWPGKTVEGSSDDFVDTAVVDCTAVPGQNSQFRESSCVNRDHHIGPPGDSIPQAVCTLGLQKLLEDGQRQLCIHCLCLL